MLQAANSETPPDKAPDAALGKDNYTLAVEALFVFALKGAKRLLEISPNETQLLKQLAVDFMSAPETERGEIMETILEIMLPDDRVGGIGDAPHFDAGIVERVKATREYIGGQIKSFRESAGLTQVALARKARIPQSHVSRLERGRLSPTRKTIKTLAKALRVKPQQLDPGYTEAQ